MAFFFAADEDGHADQADHDAGEECPGVAEIHSGPFARTIRRTSKDAGLKVLCWASETDRAVSDSGIGMNWQRMRGLQTIW